MTNSPLTTARPSRADLGLVAAYWLVVAPVLLLQYRADRGLGIGRVLPEVGATVLLDTTAVALVVGGLLPLLLSDQRRKWGLALLPLFMALSGVAYLLVYHGIRGHVVSWSFERVVLGAVAHAKSYGLLAVLLTGRRYVAAQRRVLLLQKAQAESELRALQAQVDPHFLFNNLHVLHTLIGQDADVAAHFLNRFAGLYRYLIRHREADFVPLAEELGFLDDYLYLLRHRFGTAHAFELRLAPGLDPNLRYLVPGTLQILVENVLKHNAGGDEQPLVVLIDGQAEQLTVRHPRRPKRAPAEPGTGSGLANLCERYRLLAGQSVEIRATAAEFAVTVPLLNRVSK